MVKLSASRIKTLLSCSWIYWCRYILKLPSKGNDGANRGNTVHPILECLLRKDRKDYVNKILSLEDPFCVPSVKRLAYIHAKKLEVASDENIKLIKDFLLTALKFDFYCEGALEVFSEEEFNYKTDEYWIGGFIDKKAIYPDKIKIVDYKTSKAKFTQEEISASIQALMYALVQTKQHPALFPEVEFLFLKFKKAPLQKAVVTQELLNGFEEYLKYVSKHLLNYDLQKAMSDFAANDRERMWLCGKRIGDQKKDGTSAWTCEYKYPYIYFAAKDQSGKVISTSKVKKDLDKYIEKGYSVSQMEYAGCPKFQYLWKVKS
jgi:hypothetical protein